MDGEPFGDALDQNVQGTAQHPVSADQDDAADQDADERIDPQQVSELDQNRGQNDSYRRNSVSHHVQESAVQVEILRTGGWVAMAGCSVPGSANDAAPGHDFDSAYPG